MKINQKIQWNQMKKKMVTKLSQDFSKPFELNSPVSLKTFFYYKLMHSLLYISINVQMHGSALKQFNNAIAQCERPDLEL